MADARFFPAQEPKLGLHGVLQYVARDDGIVAVHSMPAQSVKLGARQRMVGLRKHWLIRSASKEGQRAVKRSTGLLPQMLAASCRRQKISGNSRCHEPEDI